MLNLDPLIENYPNCVTEGENIKSFTSVKDEYLALKNGVGVKVCYLYNKLKLTGNEVVDYIQRISTNSVNKLGVNEHINTLFTNEKGKLIDRTTFIKLDEYNLLIGGFLPDKKLKTWFERYIISEDIFIEDYTDEIILFELIGKQTTSFLSLVLDESFETLSDKNVLRFKIDGVDFYVLKRNECNNFTKYWVLFLNSDLKSAYDFFINNKSFYDLQFVGDTAYDIFRVENGIPIAPNEISHRVNPHELKLLSEVDFRKGCYIGQEVIARLDTYDKVQRYLVAILFLEGEKLIGKDGEINLYNSERKEVGFITSFIKSELYGKYAALGFVKKDYMELGSVYDVIINNVFVTKAIITEIPIRYENIYKNR